MDILVRLRKETNEPDDEVLEGVIEDAKDTILNTRFPYGYPEGQEVEPQYRGLQYRIALAIYNKRGGDYEISHSENGISRSWGSEGVPQALLKEITPMVGGVR